MWPTATLTPYPVIAGGTYKAAFGRYIVATSYNSNSTNTCINTSPLDRGLGVDNNLFLISGGG